MAKSQTNAATGAANSLINQANTQMPTVIGGFQGEMNTAQAQSGSTFNQAQSGYQQQQQTGGYDPTQLANLRSELSNMSTTGGYDPTQLANLQTSLAGMEATGGYDPTQLANITSGYGTMAQTGGFTPAQQQAYLNQATEGTTATAGNLASAAARNASATGGNAGASIANIQRTAGQQQAQATNDALVGLNTQINQNKLAGLGGLQGTEASVAGARQGVAGLESGLQSGVAQGRTAVSGQQAGLESGVASGVGAANAGMANLFTTSSGNLTAAGQQVLQGLGLQYGTEAQGANILQQLSKNPGFLQTLIGDVGALGGAAGGLMSGLGSMGVKF